MPLQPRNPVTPPSFQNFTCAQCGFSYLAKSSTCPQCGGLSKSSGETTFKVIEPGDLKKGF